MYDFKSKIIGARKLSEKEGFNSLVQGYQNPYSYYMTSRK